MLEKFQPLEDRKNDAMAPANSVGLKDIALADWFLVGCDHHGVHVEDDTDVCSGSPSPHYKSLNAVVVIPCPALTSQLAENAMVTEA